MICFRPLSTAPNNDLMLCMSNNEPTQVLADHIRKIDFEAGG
jgi:hypothetical protein